MKLKTAQVDALKAKLRETFPGPLLVFDLEQHHRVQALIKKFELAPAEACALREDIATLVLSLQLEVPALLSELEQLTP